MDSNFNQNENMENQMNSQPDVTNNTPVAEPAQPVPETSQMQPTQAQQMPQMQPMQTQEMPQMQPMQAQQMPQMQPTQAQEMPQMQPTQAQQMPQMQPTQAQQMPQMQPMQTQQMPQMQPMQAQQMPQMQFTQPAPKKKKTGKVLAAVFGGVAIVAVVAGISFAAFNSLKPKTKNPADRVKSAYEDLTAELTSAKNSGIINFLGLDSIIENYTKGETDTQISLGIKSIQGDSSMNNVQLDLGLQTSNTPAAKMDIHVLQSGSELIGADLYMDKQNIMLAAPVLYDGYINVPITNLENDIRNSAFGQYIDESFYEAFKQVTESMESSNAATTLNEVNLYKEFADKYKDDIQAFKDSMKIEESSKKDLTIGDSSKSCQGYHVSFGKEETKKLITDFFDYLKNSEEFQTYLQEIANQVSKMSNSYDFNDDYDTNYDYGDNEDSDVNIQEIIDQFPTYLTLASSYISSMITGDPACEIYLDDDNRIVQLATAFDVDSASFDFAVNFSGKEHVTDAIDGNFAVTSGGNTVTILYRSNQKNEGSKIASEASFSVTASGQTISLGANSNYDTSSSAYDCKLYMNDGKEEYSLTATGSIEATEKGKSCTFDLEDITLSENDTDIASFSAKISLGTLSTPIAAPTDNLKNILTMSESELTSFVQEIQTNIMNSPLLSSIINSQSEPNYSGSNGSSDYNIGNGSSDYNVGNGSSDYNEYNDSDDYSSNFNSLY